MVLKGFGAPGRSPVGPLYYRLDDWDAVADEYGSVASVGRVDLFDLSLDARGVLTLYEPIDAVIARNAGAPSGYTPSRRRVPLAAVTGHLDAPRVRLDAAQVSGFLASYASDLYRDRLGQMLERKLGPGAGEVVDQGLQLLQGLLGGGRPQAPPPDTR